MTAYSYNTYSNAFLLPLYSLYTMLLTLNPYADLLITCQCWPISLKLMTLSYYTLDFIAFLFVPGGVYLMILFGKAQYSFVLSILLIPEIRFGQSTYLIHILVYRTRAGQSLYRADILSKSSRKASLKIILIQALCLNLYDIILLLMSHDSDLFIL